MEFSSNLNICYLTEGSGDCREFDLDSAISVDFVTSVDRNAFVNLLVSVDSSVLVDSSVQRGPHVSTDLSSVHGYGLATPARGAVIFSYEPTIGVDDQTLADNP
ncbi:hypothetical protein GQ457_07G003210 [Hibiscus cannabinus]